MLLAEHESRLESRRARLLKSARLPALKSLAGFDYSSVKFPEDYGREALASLEFINQAQDLVLYGDYAEENVKPSFDPVGPSFRGFTSNFSA